jgi:hypothetical protein
MNPFFPSVIPTGEPAPFAGSQWRDRGTITVSPDFRYLVAGAPRSVLERGLLGSSSLRPLRYLPSLCGKILFLPPDIRIPEQNH